MRKHLVLILSTFACISGFTQITVSSTNMATLGDTVLLAEDTVNGSTLNVGTPGGDKFWDFSMLEDQKPDGIIMEDPSTAPLFALFPDADFVGNDYEDSSHIFFKQTPSSLDVVGLVEYDSTGQPEPSWINGVWRFMQFPATIGTEFTSVAATQVQTSFFGIDLDSLGPHPYVDSLRTKIFFSIYSEIDAWGELKLPMGTFNAIRQKTATAIKFSGDCFYDGDWHPYTPLMLTFIDSVNYDTTAEGSYRWWSDNESCRLFAVQVDYDSNTIDSSVTFLNEAPIWPTGLTSTNELSFDIFPNPTSDVLNIQSNSSQAWTVNVFDIQAKNVLTKQVLDSKTEIDVSQLPSGAYMFQIISAKGQMLKLEKVLISR